MSEVQLDVAPNDQDVQLLASIRLASKRITRNAYMKKYRAHLRSLPTYAVLMKFQESSIKFVAANGVQCSACIKNGDLHISIPQGIDHICLLPTDAREAKKIVNASILAVWK